MPQVLENWQIIRNQLLSMSINEKRKFYNCFKYFILDEINVWPVYVNKNRSTLGKICVPFTNFKLNMKLNEEISKKVSLFKGDITSLEIDCIVNAANEFLLGGGGVDGAIHKSAGKHLKAECKTLGGCEPGCSKFTFGYHLPAKFVIHTVGPMDNDQSKLITCYQSCLNLFREHNLRSIAFPCIATGAYGYPADEAADIACLEVRKFLEGINLTTVDRIIFCVYSDKDLHIYEGLMQFYFPLI